MFIHITLHFKTHHPFSKHQSSAADKRLAIMIVCVSRCSENYITQLTFDVLHLGFVSNILKNNFSRCWAEGWMKHMFEEIQFSPSRTGSDHLFPLRKSLDLQSETLLALQQKQQMSRYLYKYCLYVYWRTFSLLKTLAHWLLHYTVAISDSCYWIVHSASIIR